MTLAEKISLSRNIINPNLNLKSCVLGKDVVYVDDGLEGFYFLSKRKGGENPILLIKKPLNYQNS